MHDEDFMRLAISLAERGQGRAAPDPLVGAVLVRDGRVIGQGWHARCGDLHAERAALADCSEDPRGATLYVSLEPCCHYGHQPPCTSAILEAGIARVVVGSDDPNPLVGGKGIEQLRAHGVQVETGLLKAACDALNYVFFHYIQTGRPYVTMKYAMTLDGKIATQTGASRWITGEAARQKVHAERDRSAAILVGVETVLTDDPLLTCRSEGGRDPVRVVCDSHLRTPLKSRLVRTAREVPTLLAVSGADAARVEAYRAAGCQVWELPAGNGRVDLPALLTRLGREQCSSVLLEGGAALNWAMLEAGLVQRVQAYIAPKLFGGAAARSPLGGTGVELPELAAVLSKLSVTQVGDDILVEGEVVRSVHRDR